MKLTNYISNIADLALPTIEALGVALSILLIVAAFTVILGEKSPVETSKVIVYGSLTIGVTFAIYLMAAAVIAI